MQEALTIPVETVPSIAEQAEALGWRFSIYDFGKAEQPGIDYFNPGLVERPDGLWLLVRRADMGVMNGFGMNGVLALKLDETGTVPQHGKALEWPGAQAGQQFEDARAVYIPHMDQVAVSATTFTWYGEGADPAWSGAIQVLGFFDKDWNCKVLHYPPFDANGTELKTVPREAYQKNWVWWHRNGKLHLLFKSEPWTIATFDNHWIDRRMVHVGAPLTWRYGMIRGGTPPVEIDGMLVTFFHSSTPWHDRWRRYHIGAIGFNPEPPFQPLCMTVEPLISGTTATHWGPRKPACIFPTGAVKRGDRLLVTAGVNDLKSCWFDAPIESVMSRMVPIGGAVSARQISSWSSICTEPEPKEAMPTHPTFSETSIQKVAGEIGGRIVVAKKPKKKRKAKKRTAEEQAKIDARMANLRARRKPKAAV